MFKIAMLYICTGEYIIFWKNFFDSFEKNFLPNSKKDYFVFTDAKTLYKEECGNVNKIFTPQREWPYSTLLRFKMFNSISDKLKDYDYIFFVNANGFCKELINEDEILPIKEDLIVTQNCEYANKNPNDFPYDRNKKSEAYIPFDKGKVYVSGAFNGGKSESYLKLISILDKRTDEDEKNGVIALWHDESHLNKYILENTNYKLLPPSFCYPEEFDYPFEQKIIMICKNNVIPEKKIKKNFINWKSLIFYRKFQLFFYKLKNKF
jgi:hypothetical protein